MVKYQVNEKAEKNDDEEVEKEEVEVEEEMSQGWREENSQLIKYKTVNYLVEISGQERRGAGGGGGGEGGEGGGGEGGGGGVSGRGQ